MHVDETAQLFEGPPAGPLAPVSAPAPVSESAFAPFKVLVDGDHALVAENRDGFRDPRYRIDGGDPFTLPGYVVGFAGDLVAYATDARRLVLRNWRTARSASSRFGARSCRSTCAPMAPPWPTSATAPCSAAPIGEPDAGAPGPGPCLQSEIWVDQREHAAIGRDRRVPLYLYCMAAATACQGTAYVLLPEHGRRRSASVRYSIPAGRTRRLMPRITPAAYRAARRVKDGRVQIEVGGVLTDPDGRKQRLFGQYSVAVR